jgi:hypothetical protein
MKKNHGYITNRIVKAMGIPTVYLTRMEKNKRINKVDRGIYALPSIFEDNLYIHYLRYNKIVYTGNTALVLNGMSNRSLKNIEANVPYNYNTHRINEFDAIRVNETVYNLGRVFIETEFGNKVPTYNKERVLCDIFIDDNLDNEALNYAIKEAKIKKIDYEVLYEYSVLLNVYEKIKLLLEIRDEY